MSTNKVTDKDIESVFREYHSRLYFFALNFLEDKNMAEDIVSEVFVATWTTRENISCEKLVGYLYSGVRNRCINEMKRSGRNIALDDAYIDADAPRPSDKTFADCINNRIR